MLAALAASRDRQRRLVADAGHELRTPLTSLRTNLDLLAQADGDGGLPAEARRELLDDVRGQIEELTTLVGDLVVLAREEPITAASVEPLDLAEVADRAVTRVRRRAPGVDFDVASSRGRSTATPPASSARSPTCSTTPRSGARPAGRSPCGSRRGVLTVDDQGPGIAETDLPHVFERF